MAALLAAAGCTAKTPRGTAHGTVKVTGKPVTKGAVVFTSAAAGMSVMMNLGDDGSFSMGTYEGDGLPLGEYQVSISPVGLSNGDVMIVGVSPPRNLPTADVPEKYRDPKTSGLAVTVKEGENPAFDFDLAE